MRKSLPLESLWAFHVVADTGSLTAAAARLGVTQPAVSRRLRELEADLGVALVRRGANALRLTEEGGRFAAAIGEGFVRIRRAIEALSNRPPAPLRARAYTTWAQRWLIPRLARFSAGHAGLPVEVVTSTTPVDFARDPVDAAIRTAPGGRPPAPGATRLQAIAVATFASPAIAPRRAAASRGSPCSAAWCGRTTGPRGSSRKASRRRPRRRCSSRARRWRSRRRWKAWAR